MKEVGEIGKVQAGATWSAGTNRLSGARPRALRLLFEAMLEIAALHEVVYDAAGRATDYRVLDCNAAFTRIVGISRETARGSLGSLLYGTSPAPYLDVYARVVATGVHEAFETYFPPLDKHFQISVVPMEGGQFATLATDITDRKRSEEALRRSEEGLRAAQSVSHVGSWTWHVQTGQLEWSEEMYEIFGIDRAHFSGNLAEVVARAIHPDDQAAVARSNQRVLEEGQPTPLEYRICRPDGSVRTAWAEAGSLQRDQAGRPERLTGIVMDVTERRQLDLALLESNERFLAAFQASPVAMVLSRAEDGLFLDVNRAAEETFGWRREEVVGRSALEIELWVCSEARDELVEALLRDGLVHRREVRLRHKDGRELLTQVSGRPISLRGVTHLLFVTEDITAQRAVQAQLLQAQKMESVGLLAGGIAHDFNNILAVILGYTSSALADLEPGQPLREDLQEIQRAAQRSADLTRQLLAFARKQTISPTTLDLNVTVAATMKMLQRMLGEDIRLTWRPGADLWPIRMDPSQIDQILTNLCVNARDAITGVGALTIETGNVSWDQAACAGRPDARPGEYVWLSVSDDGCGMDQETRTRIFEPFFTTKARGKGTGLGLATTYGIVTQNAGFIDVESEPGAGATFTIYLPRPLGQEQPDRRGAATPTTSPGHAAILLVEDEAAILRVTKRMLEREGYQVLAAGTPGEALRLAAELTGPLHLLLTDVVMPEMNGHDLSRRLLAVRPDLKLLFMSGYAAEIITHQGVLGAGVAFIQKPFMAEELAAAVRAALAG